MKSILVLAYRIVVMAEQKSNIQGIGKSTLPNHDAPSLTRHNLCHLYMILMVWA
jgi:hypothetical protein